MNTAAQICEWAGVSQGTASKNSIRRVFAMADEEGTIQAQDMFAITSDPTEHTTTSLRHALILIGCVPLNAESDDYDESPRDDYDVC